MLNSNTLNWNQVRADFGDTNTAMNTAIGGFSKAGDVFTKMRDRLAAEEQQEWENQYKQDVFNESIRATNLADENADLDRDQAKLIAEWDKQVREKANAINQQRVNLADRQYYDTRADLSKVDEAIRDLTNGQHLYAQVKEHTPRFIELQQAVDSKKPLTEAESKEYKALSDERTNFAKLQMPETLLSPTGAQQYLLSRLGSLYKLVPGIIDTRATNEYNAKLAHDTEIKARQEQGRTKAYAHASNFKESGSGGVITTAYEALLKNTDIDPLEIAGILQQVEYNTGHWFDTDPDDVAEQVIDLFKSYGLEDKELKKLATQLNTSYTPSNKNSSSSSSSTDSNLTGGMGSLINRAANINTGATETKTSDTTLKDSSEKSKKEATERWNQFVQLLQEGVKNHEGYQSLYSFYKDSVKPPVVNTTKQFLDFLSEYNSSIPEDPSSLDDTAVVEMLMQTILQNSGNNPINIGPNLGPEWRLNLEDTKQRLMNPSVQTRNYRPGESLRIDQFGNPAAIRWNPIK